MEQWLGTLVMPSVVLVSSLGSVKLVACRCRRVTGCPLCAELFSALVDEL